MFEVSVVATLSACGFFCEFEQEQHHWQLYLKNHFPAPHLYVVICSLSPFDWKNIHLWGFDYTNIQFQHPELPGFQLHLKCLWLCFFLSNLDQFLYFQCCKYKRRWHITATLRSHTGGYLTCFSFSLCTPFFFVSNQCNYSSATTLIFNSILLVPFCLLIVHADSQPQ